MVFLLSIGHSVGSVLTIILMFMSGYWMAHIGWLGERDSVTFSKIILNFSLPCYMFYNIATSFTRQSLESLSAGILVPFLSIGINYLMAVAVSRLIKVPRSRRGVFRSIFFTSNTIFIGLAVNEALFGGKAVPYVLLYYIANTTFFWTIGVYEISRDGAASAGIKQPRLVSRAGLKRLFPPALAGFLIGIVFVLLNIKVPAFLMDTTKYLGELTTPLAMLFIGIVLHSVKLRDIRLGRESIVLILARFMICPLTILVLEPFFHLPQLMGNVFVIQAAMPAMTSTGAVAKEYGSDYEFATVTTAITTVLSMVAIPVYMAFLKGA